MYAVLLALHALAATVWVGGMAFAYGALRPAAGALDPPVRQALWRRVFARFFPWVWISVALLLATGYGLLFGLLGGFAGTGVHVHVMHLTGWVMMLVFGHLYFVPWRRFQRALDAGETPEAGRQLDIIRRIVLFNLCLGLATVAIGASGRFW